jgi:iron complex outermembrane receptor protein
MGYSKFKNLKLQLNTEFPLGPGVVTFIPTYDHINQRNANVATDRQTGEPTGGIRQGGRYGFETSTAELRYAASADSDIQWVGGLYWTETNEPGTPRTDPDPQLRWSKALAVFGQMVYPFSDRLRGTVGFRYDKDEKGYERITRIEPPYPQTASFDFDYFDWKLGIELDHSEDIMSYFSLATGHRPGGYADRTGKPFEIESLISAEYGFKSRLMNNRFQLNSSIFYYDYKDYQSVDFWLEWDEEEQRDVFMVEYFNVDKAVNYGIEIETTTLLTPNTTFDLDVTYLHNEYKSDFILHPDPMGPGINMKGAPFPQSPEFTFRAAIDHTFTLPSGDTLKPRISARYTGERHIEFIATPATLGPSYTVVDASLTYSSQYNWSLNLYANNALDEIYANAMRTMPPPGSFMVGPRREVGMTFNIRF